MASVRQQITLEPSESDALRACLGNRQIDPVLTEIRAAFNGPAQPSPDGEKRSTLVTQLRPGHELTEQVLHDTLAAIRSRTRLLAAVVDLLGQQQAPQAQQLLEVHRHAETVVDSIAAALTSPAEPVPAAPTPAGHS